MDEQLILIDEHDREIGVGEKMATHREGKLHRAFSVIILNAKGEMLLQKRAASKYHSGGLWSNACCGHPRPGEPTAQAGRRRLQEEMGFDCELHEVFAFAYRAQLDGGLVENECDHVLVGHCDNPPIAPDPDEVGDWRWMLPDALREDMQANPDAYTYWFKDLMAREEARNL